MDKERISAFTPKTQEQDPVLSKEKNEKVEAPLQSLEKDKSQISGFNLVLKEVIAGTITEVGIRALATKDFQYFSDGGDTYLVDQSGSRVVVDGAFVRRGFLHGMK